jgi:type II secretory pathway component PulM
MNNDLKALSNMSLTELKQLLSCVNQDLKSIKKAEKIAAENVPSEYDICNSLSAKFNKNINIESVENAKLKADIQIQKDILDYLNNGGHIITRVNRKKIKPLTVLSYHKVSL